ncbi:glycoside hydrolase family 2 protein [Pedobacter arcticus]|uniref:glycoside hydrolase family 2 protein n=1 Tax=Pedobacter arcticus TaxID=752140 RepID=UPI0012B52FBB|nr:glycoside hydrolase family 2 TIM barrel-domain containing protein [Pedobacter arcticus]
MRRITLMLCLVCFSFLAFAQRDTIALNKSWKFTTDKKAEGLNQQWFKTSLKNTKTVTAPHTWNVEKENQNFYGWGWYQNEISAPEDWKNKNVVIEFGAINHTAYIYLNGEKIQENIGDGFDKIYVNLNGKLKYGQKNVLTVAVNNDYGRNKVPFGNSFDWPNDGGLIRKVKLIVSGKPAASYVNVDPILELKDSSAKVKIKLGFDDLAKTDLKFKVTITEDNQATNKVVLSKISKATVNNGVAVIDYDLTKVNPWHFDHPNLYRIDVQVLKNNKAVDHISTSVGFRDFRFKDGKTYLNGEHVKLMGIEWTAGSNPNFGFAEPDDEILKHGRLMKEVNAIFSRIHFQQDDLFYDFCDRKGIILQAEVPLWGWETPSNDTIKTIATSQLTKMVQQRYNHPSIYAWGVGNELRGRDKNMKQMIEGLLQKARDLDPKRMVSYVSNTLKDGFNNNPNFVPDAGSLGDYLMMNEYSASWWGIPEAKLSNYLDSIHTSYPNKPLFISEFGLCGPNFKGGDERRVRDMIYHMAVYESKSYVEGAIYFDLTDYRTHYPGTFDKDKFRRRVHGVFDMYGVAKPSAKILRELSSPIEVQRLEGAKGKMSVMMFGSLGLPQHSVSGYKLYISDKEDNFKNYKAYDLPTIKPGEQLFFPVDDLFDGKGIITVVKPTGYIATQKDFYE